VLASWSRAPQAAADVVIVVCFTWVYPAIAALMPFNNRPWGSDLTRSRGCIYLLVLARCSAKYLAALVSSVAVSM